MKKIRRWLAALSGALLLTAVTGGMTAAGAAANDEQSRRDAVEIFCSMCNDARVAEGLQEMYIAPPLVSYAQTRAEDLTTLFGHYRPDGSICFSVMKNDGFFYNNCAENIAAGGFGAEETFYQWMNSQGHHDNIMTESMTHIGTGFVYDADAKPDPDGIPYAFYWSMFLIGSYDANDTPVTYEGQYIPDREPGDANGTKRIDAADAARILEYSAARSAGGNPRVTKQFMAAADVNGDGSINAIDAHIVLSFSAAQGADPNAAIADFIWK